MAKIKSLLFIYIMLSMFQITAQAKEEHIESINILNSLGITNKISINNFDENSTITRMDFISCVCRMMTNDSLTENEALTMAQGKELITNPVGDLRYQDNIILQDAVKVLVCSLGYGEMAKYKGGYPTGYITIAKDLGILKGVTGSYIQTASYGDVLKLLCNAIDADVCEPVSFGENKIYLLGGNKTILSLYRDIYKVKGIVTQNKYTALSGDFALSNDKISIDNIIYQTSDSSAHQMLGLNVTAYVHIGSDDDYGEIRYIAISESKNNVTDIAASDITGVSDDCKQIKYINSDERADIKYLSDVVSVIYNGKAYYDYSSEDLMISDGKLKLIDTNNDDKADVLFVSSYETVVVDYVSTQCKRIYNKYSYKGSIGSIEVDTSSSDYDVLCIKNGTEIGIGEIKEWNVLSVAVSKSGRKLLKTIIVSEKSVQGDVEAYDEINKKITILGADYEINDVYFNMLDDYTGDNQKILIGVRHKFYLDTDGRVAAVFSDELVAIEYVYGIEMGKEQGLNTKVEFKYINTSGEWVVSQLAQNITYNEDNKRMESELIMNELKPGGIFIQQMYAIKKDKNGFISGLTTPERVTVPEKGRFTEYIIQNQFRKNDTTFDHEVYLDSDTVVFWVPWNQSDDKLDFYVSGTGELVGDRSYSAQAYNLDDFYHTKILVLKTTPYEISSLYLKQKLFVVDRIVDTLNDDGEVLKRIYGGMSNYPNISAVSRNSDVFKGLKKGDVVYLHIDVNGYVVNVTKKKKFSSGRERILPAEGYQIGVLFAGDVSNVNPTVGRLLLECGNSGEKRIFDVDKTVPAMVYDVVADKMKAGTVADVEIGDYAMIVTEWTKIQEVIIFKYGKEGEQ